MKRLLIPFSVALLVHVLLLRLQGDWFQKRVFHARPAPIALALTYVKPKAPPLPSVPPPSKKVEEKQAPVIPEIKPPPQPPEPPKKIEPERPPVPKPKVVKSKPPRIRKPKRKVVEKETVVPTPRPEPPPQPPRNEEPVLSAPPSPPSSDREPRTEALAPNQASPMPDLKSDDDAQVAALTPDKPPLEAIPLYRENPPPAYPRIARRKGYEGTVVLEVLVGHDGRVNDLRVLQSCGHEVLDEAAADSVRSWLFEPGRIGEEPVEMWVKVPVRFQLRE